MEYLIFSFIPFSSLILLFLKDNELKRKKLLNIGLIKMLPYTFLDKDISWFSLASKIVLIILFPGYAVD